ALSGMIFLNMEITILENISTTVVDNPIPTPLMADVVTASVGHIPSVRTKVGFSLIIPLIKRSIGFGFILFPSLQAVSISNTAVDGACYRAACDRCSADGIDFGVVICT